MAGYAGKPYRRRNSVRRAVKPVNRRFVRKAVTKAKARNFRKAVTSVINKHVETKFKSHSYNLSPVYGAGLNYAAMDAATQRGLCHNNVMQDLAITKGYQSNERVGSVINPVYMRIAGYVVTQPYSSDGGSGSGTFNECTLPYTVKILVFKFKPGMALPLSPAHALDMVLVNDAAVGTPQTDVAFDGSIEREMLPLAHQIKPLAARSLKMRPPLSGTTDPTINSQTSNAPSYRYFRMYVPMPKKLLYEPGVDRPTNCWFSLSARIVDGSGTSIHQQQVRCKLYARATLAYKDA